MGGQKIPVTDLKTTAALIASIAESGFDDALNHNNYAELVQDPEFQNFLKIFVSARTSLNEKVKDYIRQIKEEEQPILNNDILQGAIAELD